jgi:hypothetical protein
VTALLLSAALVLSAAGCGSDNESDATTAPVESEVPGATTAGSAEPVDVVAGQGVSDTEIKIGVVVDDSGPFAQFSPSIRAVFDAKVSAVNDNGGIAGRQLKVIYYDSKSDPATHLINDKRLWEEDEVLMIYSADLAGPSLDYSTEQEIPVALGFGSPAIFSSKYPTVVSIASMLTALSAQMAYAVVNYQDKQPKNVAVSIYPFEEPLRFWIEDYWKELGAETVTIDVGVDPTADCSALVLKYQAADIDFWQFNDNSWLACIPAQLNAGWSPELGQGGPGTSQVSTADLIGQPMADLEVIAGAAIFADGRPVHAEPQPDNIEYTETIEKYAPEFATDRQLNDSLQVAVWVTASLIADAIEGAAASGELSPASINKWMLETEDWPTPMADPIPSLAGDCKSGNDATLWGTYEWDETKQELYVEPFAPAEGEALINNDWFDPDPCYLTKLADEYYVD